MALRVGFDTDCGPRAPALPFGLRWSGVARGSHGGVRERFPLGLPQHRPLRASPVACVSFNAAAAITTLALLASCASAPAPPPTITVCPALVTYSAADQAKAGAELKALPPGDVLARFIVDYGQLRAQVRAGCLTPPPN